MQLSSLRQRAVSTSEILYVSCRHLPMVARCLEPRSRSSADGYPSTSDFGNIFDNCATHTGAVQAADLQWKGSPPPPRENGEPDPPQVWLLRWARRRILRDQIEYPGGGEAPLWFRKWMALLVRDEVQQTKLRAHSCCVASVLRLTVTMFEVELGARESAEVAASKCHPHHVCSIKTQKICREKKLDDSSRRYQSSVSTLGRILRWMERLLQPAYKQQVSLAFGSRTDSLVYFSHPFDWGGAPFLPSPARCSLLLITQFAAESASDDQKASGQCASPSTGARRVSRSRCGR